MKVSDKGAVVGLLFLMTFMYVVVQINYISFYRQMGIPFGRSDVDEYMKDIAKPDVSMGDHILMIYAAKASSLFTPPGEFLTYFIPIMLCLVMPFTVFVLAFMLSEDGTVAFYSTIMTVFGTIITLAFGISAMWAQMESTIFLMWFLILYEIYIKSKSKSMLVLVVASVILAVVAHYKATIFIPMYMLIRYFVNGRAALATTAAAICFFTVMLVHGTAFDPYPYNVDATYVFTHFMFPALWFLAAYYMITDYEVSSAKMRSVMLLSVAVLFISSMTVLWRPLLTVLPLLSLFATMGLFKLMKKMNPKIAIVVGAITVLILMVFFFYMFQNCMFAMYQEIVPGIYNDTRTTVDMAKFVNMYFPGSEIKVTGYVTVFGNNTMETTKIVNNGSPQIIGII